MERKFIVKVNGSSADRALKRCIAMSKRLLLLIFVFNLLVYSAGLYAAEKYEFVKMWPDRKQWHFSPCSIAIDKDNYVYILNDWWVSYAEDDKASYPTIMKFDPMGNLIVQWGRYGREEGNFKHPRDIMIDQKRGYVYVSDGGNKRIQKFTANGKFLKTWSVEEPGEMAIDLKGNLYVQVSKQVLKFNSEGVLLKSFDIDVVGIALDKNDNIWTLSGSSLLSPVKIYNQEVKEINRWQTLSENDWSFIDPQTIAIDKEENIYIADACTSGTPADWGNSNFIGKFTKNGVSLKTIGGCGHEDGQFYNPSGITFDTHGNMWVCDDGRVQKFDKEGQFISTWDNGASSKSGRFCFGPEQIFVDETDIIYVIDAQENWVNYLGPTRIQSFDSEGRFLSEWIDRESGWDRHSGFSPITTIDSEGNIYVDSDVYNSDESQPIIIDKVGVNVKMEDGWEISKKDVGFPPNGESLEIARGCLSRTIDDMHVDKKDNLFLVVSLEGQSQYILKINKKSEIIKKITLGSILFGDYRDYAYSFANARCLYFDWEENVYIVTVDGILKYSNGLEFLKRIEIKNNISVPGGMALDRIGNIYVTDAKNNCVVKFDTEGNEITRWGKFGYGTGDLNVPSGIGVDSKGNVYVADTYNHRVQKFAPVR